MRYRKIYLFTLGVILSTCTSSLLTHAQEYVYPLVLTNVDARVMSMGGLSLGESTSNFLYANPASFLRSNASIYVSAASGFATESTEVGRPKVFAGSVGVSRWGVALMAGYRYKGGMEMPKYDPMGMEIPGKTVKLMDRSFDFALAYNPFTSIPLGFYAKYASYLTAYGRNAVAHSTTWGVSYLQDLTISESRYANKLTATVELADVGRHFSDGTATVLRLPSSVSGALSWKFEDHTSKLSTTLGTQGRYYFGLTNEKLMQVSVGSEVQYNNFLSVRAGYQYAWRNLSYLGAGLGIRWNYLEFNLAGQYSLSKDRFVNSVLLGLNFQL